MILEDGKGVSFSINNKQYTIGDEYFPVKDISKAEYFDNEKCKKKLKLAKLINAIDKETFETGRCYTNTAKIVDIGKSVDVDIKFYAGWIFLKTFKAIHHAFGVVKTKFGAMVVDAGISNKELEMYASFDDDFYKQDNWRAVIAKETLKLKKLKNSENMVLGIPPKGVLYVGCEDNKENAVNTFINLRENKPNHPSYGGGGNMGGRSKLQEEINRLEN